MTKSPGTRPPVSPPDKQVDPRWALLREVVAGQAAQPGGLIPALHQMQDRLGYIPPELVGEIALEFNLSRAEVHGVITFYPHFRSEPAGRHTLEVCRAESCQAMGGEALAMHARERLGCDFHAASADGEFSLEPVYCLGLLWLEPLVEVATPQGRTAYGPVAPEDVAGLFDAGWLDGGKHALGHGPTEDIPYLKRQERLTFARVGVTDPLSLQDYEAHGGLQGLRRALSMAPEQIVDEVTASGLRGRGGAAFPTGIKWKTVLGSPASQKYVVCNADEGDSGTFADRLLMEGDPYTLIEGMAIAGLATGATHGYIYVRSEYPHAIAALEEAIARARAAGWLGADIHGSDRAFDLEVRKGAGAYICGEETSLLESIEGKRGVVRAKPPLPAVKGLFGKPTVINNVISLASVPVILARGANYYRDFGVGRSHGTLPFQLAGNIKQGGLVEKAFGVTLRELLYDFGGGSASGRKLRAVQVGGPLGAYLPESQWDVPLDYEAYIKISAMVGHGGLVAFDDTVDMLHMARYALEFCAVESCGKCTPCRIGSTRGMETIDRIAAAGPDKAEARAQQVHLLRDLCDTMLGGSLCALGGMAPYPVLSALDHFSEDFGIPSTRAVAAST